MQKSSYNRMMLTSFSVGLVHCILLAVNIDRDNFLFLLAYPTYTTFSLSLINILKEYPFLTV